MDINWIVQERNETVQERNRTVQDRSLTVYDKIWSQEDIKLLFKPDIGLFKTKVDCSRLSKREIALFNTEIGLIKTVQDINWTVQEGN